MLQAIGVLRAVFLTTMLLHLTAGETAATSRLVADAAAGRPLVAHVIVALCDNRNQGIVPVPAALGNGQDARSNLYWGALYGVRTYLPRMGWTRIAAEVRARDGVLDQIVLRRSIATPSGERIVYVVAEAWDGARIRDAITRTLRCAAGHDVSTLECDGKRLPLGGGAHAVIYIGHNGLMDFAVDPPPSPPEGAAARAAMMLCCRSRPHFTGHLATARAEPLLLTSGLMAPEAYVLDAALCAWFASGRSAATVESAAVAYDRFQHCGLTAARRLFTAGP